jgi:hypothetical protein
VITGLTFGKLGHVFHELSNVTIATSHGLVYSLGEDLRQLYERRRSVLAQASHDGYSPHKYLSNSPRTPANKRK